MSNHEALVIKKALTVVDEKLDQCKKNMCIAVLLRDTNKQALYCGEDPMN